MSDGSVLEQETGEDRPVDLARYRSALRDWLDSHGETLRVSQQAAADELAGDAEMVRRLYAASFSRRGWPASVGGTGGGVLHRAVLYDELTRAHFAVPHWSLSFEVCAPAIQQFGRSIASFQAVKHHLARVKVAIEAARPVVRTSWENDSEFPTIAAKALAGAAYLEAHNRGIHVMGGMGYSRDHPIGRYHSTGLALEALGGSTRTNSQALASVARSSPSTLRSPVVP